MAPNRTLRLYLDLTHVPAPPFGINPLIVGAPVLAWMSFWVISGAA